jgi:hypothetical protein
MGIIKMTVKLPHIGNDIDNAVVAIEKVNLTLK